MDNGLLKYIMGSQYLPDALEMLALQKRLETLQKKKEMQLRIQMLEKELVDTAPPCPSNSTTGDDVKHNEKLVNKCPKTVMVVQEKPKVQQPTLKTIQHRSEHKVHATPKSKCPLL